MWYISNKIKIKRREKGNEKEALGRSRDGSRILFIVSKTKNTREDIKLVIVNVLI